MWRMKEVFQAVIQHFIGSQKVRLLKKLQLMGGWRKRNTFSYCQPPSCIVTTQYNCVLPCGVSPGLPVVAICMSPSSK